MEQEHRLEITAYQQVAFTPLDPVEEFQLAVLNAWNAIPKVTDLSDESLEVIRLACEPHLKKFHPRVKLGVTRSDRFPKTDVDFSFDSDNPAVKEVMERAAKTPPLAGAILNNPQILNGQFD